MSSPRADEDQVTYYSTATVRTVAKGEATPAELLRLIKSKAPDATIFDEDGVRPFTWTADVSNNKLDSYFTRQDTTSLRNYTKDANDGVMFLDSHDKRQLGFGQSIRGVFEASNGKVNEREPNDNDPAVVSVDFFTIPGVQLGRASSDSFIASVRSGMIRDVSIGFMPDHFECNLCKADPFDWWSMECMHIPGAYYDKAGKNIVTKRTDGAIQAFAWVRDSRLLEVSAVYDGATPGAYIKKAQWLAEAGEVDRAAASILTRQLRINLPQKAMTVPVLKIRDGKMFLDRGDEVIIDGVRYNEGMEVMPKMFRRLTENRAEHDDPEPVETTADDDAQQEPSPPPENQNLKREESPAGVADSSGGITSPAHAAPEDLRMSGLTDEQVKQLQEQAARDGDMVTRARRALGVFAIKDAETVDLESAVARLCEQVVDLTPRAQMGDEWRKQEIERALDSGVRAMNTDFKRDEWEQTFAQMPVKQIQLLAASWERQAPDLGGGRRTADIGTDPPRGGEKKAEPAAPAAQFAVNGRR